jgi:alkylresorcinol/alkylpyrone synthase
LNIASAATAFPEHSYDQATVTAHLRRIWAEHPEVVRRLETLHASCGVERRSFVLPLERYQELERFGQFNDEWIRAALELGQRAIQAALDRAGLVPADVDLLLVASVTGVAAPSLDARLMNRMGFRPDSSACPCSAWAASPAPRWWRARPTSCAARRTRSRWC